MLDEGYLLGQCVFYVYLLRQREGEDGAGAGGICGLYVPLCASMIVHIGRRRYACAARQAQRQQVRSSAICERAHNLAQHRSRQIEQTHIGNPGKIHQKRRAFQWHPAARAARPAPPGRSLLARRCLSALAEREREQRRIIARKRPTAAPRRRCALAVAERSPARCMTTIYRR